MPSITEGWVRSLVLVLIMRLERDKRGPWLLSLVVTTLEPSSLVMELSIGL